MTNDIVHGIYVGDLNGLLTLSEAFDALAERYRGRGVPLSGRACELQANVARLTTAATAARRRATAARNPQGNSSTGTGEVVGVNQASDLLGISRQAVRKNCATGRLEASKSPDKSWLIARASVDRLAYAKESK